MNPPSPSMRRLVWLMVVVVLLTATPSLSSPLVDIKLANEAAHANQLAHEKMMNIAALQQQLLKLLPPEQNSLLEESGDRRTSSSSSSSIPPMRFAEVNDRMMDESLAKLSATNTKYGSPVMFRNLRRETQMAISGLSASQMRRVIRRLQSQLSQAYGHHKRVLQQQILIIQRNMQLLKPFKKLGKRTHRAGARTPHPDMISTIHDMRRVEQMMNNVLDGKTQQLQMNNVLDGKTQQQQQQQPKPKPLLSAVQQSTLKQLSSIVRKVPRKQQRKLKVKQSVKKLLAGESEEHLRFIEHKLMEEMPKASPARKKVIAKELKLVAKKLLKFRKRTLKQQKGKMKQASAAVTAAKQQMNAQKDVVKTMQKRLTKVKQAAKRAMTIAQASDKPAQQAKALKLIKAAKSMKKMVKQQNKSVKKLKKIVKKDEKVLKKAAKTLRVDQEKVKNVKKVARVVAKKPSLSFVDHVKKDVKGKSVKQLQKILATLEKQLKKAKSPLKVKQLQRAIAVVKAKIQRKMASGHVKGHHHAGGVIKSTQQVIKGRSLSSLRALHQTLLSQMASMGTKDPQRKALQKQDDALVAAIRRKRHQKHQKNPAKVNAKHRQQRQKVKAAAKKAFKHMPVKVMKSTLTRLERTAAATTSRKQQRVLNVQMRTLSRKLDRKKVVKKIMKDVKKKVKKTKKLSPAAAAAAAIGQPQGDVLANAKGLVQTLTQQQQWFSRVGRIASKVQAAVNQERLKRARVKLQQMAVIDQQLSSMPLPANTLANTAQAVLNTLKPSPSSLRRRRRRRRRRHLSGKKGKKPSASAKGGLPGGLRVALEDPVIVFPQITPRNTLTHPVLGMTKQASNAYVTNGKFKPTITRIHHLSHKDNSVTPVSTSIVTPTTVMCGASPC